MISSEDHHNNNNDPLDTTVVFGAIALAVVFLIAFLIYVNRKWRPVSKTTFVPFQCCEEILLKSKSKKLSDINGRPFEIHSHELISLAEKGRVHTTTTGPGSCASSSCSTTSAEDEPRRGSKALRHRESRGSGSGSSSGQAIPTASGLYILPDTKLDIAPLEHQQDQESTLFDVTDLQSDFGEREENTRGVQIKCGSLEVAFAYDAPMRKMTVHVLQARGIPGKENGGFSHTQARLLLLPSKKQKHKTKIRSGETPQFLECFLFHRVNPEDVNSMGVRFRLYGCERMKREKMIGEAAVSFAAMNLELETNMWLMLEPRANPAITSSSYDLLSLTHSDSICSTQTQQHGGVPELLLGLAYSANTGRLAVEVIKGSHLSLSEPYRNISVPRPPDTYVKMCLVSSSGQELARCKTSVRRGQPNPLYKETFAFQVALFQLFDVTLMISVYTKRSMKRREMIGWFSLGLNSSGEEELSHWHDMKEASGEQLCRWHILADS